MMTNQFDWLFYAGSFLVFENFTHIDLRSLHSRLIMTG